MNERLPEAVIPLDRVRPAAAIVLDEIDLYVTMKCNLTCDFCSVCASEYEHEDLPLERILGIIDEAAALGLKELHFTGGEPTVRKDLEEMIAYAVKRGLHTRVITNGYKLSRARLKRFVECGLPDIMISLDGMGDTHNDMRGRRDSFQRAQRVVRDSVDLGLRTRVSAVAFRENRHEMIPLMLWARDAGCRVFSMFLGSPLGRGQRYRMHSILGAQEWRELCDEMRESMVKHDVQMEVILEQGFQYADGPVVDRAQLKGRGTGCATLLDSFDYLILRSDGNLYQCVFFVVDGEPIANVANTGLREALTTARHNAVYRPFTRPQDRCVSCEHQVPCGTGCRGYAWLYRGDWLKTDPRCVHAGDGKPAHFPLCPILKVNAGSGKFGGSSEQALKG